MGKPSLEPSRPLPRARLPGESRPSGPLQAVPAGPPGLQLSLLRVQAAEEGQGQQGKREGVAAASGRPGLGAQLPQDARGLQFCRFFSSLEGESERYVGLGGWLLVRGPVGFPGQKRGVCCKRQGWGGPCAGGGCGELPQEMRFPRIQGGPSLAPAAAAGS